MSRANKAIVEKLDRIIYFLTVRRHACTTRQQADWEAYYNAIVDVRNARTKFLAEAS